MSREFCSKNDGIGDRGERRARNYFVWRRRVLVDRNQHYNDLSCPCFFSVKATARFKDTPTGWRTKRDASRKNFLTPRDTRLLFNETCTARSPVKSDHRAKRNVRTFVRPVGCITCGITLDVVNASETTRAGSATFMKYGNPYYVKHDLCDVCAKKAQEK